MDFRRRAPRVQTDWVGLCRPEDEAETRWDCTVIDISLLGVGVEVSGQVGDLVGQNLVIDVRPPLGTSIRLHLVGQVMNQSTTPRGRTRVGLQFVDLSDSEIAVLEVIEQMRMFW